MVWTAVEILNWSQNVEKENYDKFSQIVLENLIKVRLRQTINHLELSHSFVEETTASSQCNQERAINQNHIKLIRPQ